jgi:predicted metal-dependent phosphoesterase TrpH
MSFADLHIHTVFSDGKKTVEEIFQKAKENNLKAISITDHDTVESAYSAYECSKKYSVEYISGIELSCYENDKEYHILGYGIDIENKKLKDKLAVIREARLVRAEKILGKLREMNMDINIDHLLESYGNVPIARPHIAQLMMELGYVKNYREAFYQYIGDGKPAYESKDLFPVEDGIKLINQAGGIASIAHPAKMVSHDDLNKIIKKGLDGIEVYHPMHDSYLQNYYRAVAYQYMLLETGGSDYHGIKETDESNFGKFTCSYGVFESIRKKVSTKSMF